MFALGHTRSRHHHHLLVVVAVVASRHAMGGKGDR